MAGIAARKGQILGVKPSVSYPLTHQYREAAGWNIPPLVHEYQEMTGWTINPNTFEYQEMAGWNIPATVTEYQEIAGWNIGPAVSYWDEVSFLYNFNSNLDDEGPNTLGAPSSGGTPTVDTVNKQFGAGSLGLDGSSWLELPNNALWDLTGEFIIAFWVRPTTGGSGTVLEIGNWNSGGCLVRSVGGGNATLYASGVTVTAGPTPLNEWTFVMFIRDASNDIRGFTGGKYVGSSVNSSNSFTTTVGARIGRDLSIGTEWLTGNLDSLMLVKGASLPFTDGFRPPSDPHTRATPEDWGALPAYQNTGGKGNRSGLGIVITTDLSISGTTDKLLNGSTASDFYFVTVSDVTGKHITIDFGAAVWMDQLRLRSANTNYNSGYWQPQYSDNGTDWTNCGAVQRLKGVSAKTDANMYVDFDNTTAHRYYRLLGSSGNIAQSFNHELEFRLAPGL